jgi:hypothetical protein
MLTIESRNGRHRDYPPRGVVVVDDRDLISQATAARWLGLTPARISQLVRFWSAPTQMHEGRRYLLWPDFPSWYFRGLRLGLWSDEEVSR